MEGKTGKLRTRHREALESGKNTPQRTSALRQGSPPYWVLQLETFVPVLCDLMFLSGESSPGRFGPFTSFPSELED